MKYLVERVPYGLVERVPYGLVERVCRPVEGCGGAGPSGFQPAGAGGQSWSPPAGRNPDGREPPGAWPVILSITQEYVNKHTKPLKI